MDEIIPVEGDLGLLRGHWYLDISSHKGTKFYSTVEGKKKKKEALN